jgi:hypothetical protein
MVDWPQTVRSTNMGAVIDQLDSDTGQQIKQLTILLGFDSVIAQLAIGPDPAPPIRQAF